MFGAGESGLLGTEFAIGFWHPFGPHGGESTREILARKQREIDGNGWTLWSFQNRCRSLPTWTAALAGQAPGTVWALCSDSKGTKEPAGFRRLSAHYCPSGEQEWRPIPPAIKVPHPYGRSAVASAFIVDRIVLTRRAADEVEFVEWLRTKDRKWPAGRIPTRGEYLIRRGGTTSLRPVAAVLVLKAPYLAAVKSDRAPASGGPEVATGACGFPPRHGEG